MRYRGLIFSWARGHFERAGEVKCELALQAANVSHVNEDIKCASCKYFEFLAEKVSDYCRV